MEDDDEDVEEVAELFGGDSEEEHIAHLHRSAAEALHPSHSICL